MNCPSLFQAAQKPFGLWCQQFLDFLGLLVVQGGPGTKPPHCSLMVSFSTNLLHENMNTYVFSILSWIPLNHKKPPVSLFKIKASLYLCDRVKLDPPALHQLLLVPLLRPNPSFPAVQGVQTRAAQPSHPRVEPPRLQAREDRDAREDPEPRALLYYPGIQSQNSPAGGTKTP